MLRSGHLRNPGFPFFIGRRDPSSALCNPPPGSRHPISGVRDCRLRIPDSAIYIYLLPINRPCGRYVTGAPYTNVVNAYSRSSSRSSSSRSSSSSIWIRPGGTSQIFFLNHIQKRFLNQCLALYALGSEHYPFLFFRI